jgi:gingipain R
MRKIILSLVAFAFVYSVTAQQNQITVKLLPKEGPMLSVDPAVYALTPAANATGTFTSRIDAPGSTYFMEAGAPELPVFTKSVVIPPTGGVKYEVFYSSYEDIPDAAIVPSKGSLKRNIDPATVPYTFGPAYSTDAFYPGNLFKGSDPVIVRNERRMAVQLYPFQYNPVTRTLRVYHNLNVVVLPNAAGKTKNELNSVRGNNPDAQVQYTPLGETGRMLIIAPQSYYNDLLPLISWKKEKGIETDFADVATVGNSQASIKSYVSTYYGQHSDLMFLLLVGDHAQVNSYNAGMSGSEIKWSDSEYGQLAGNDKYPEIYVGRLPAASTAEVQTMVTRIVEYEKTPDMGSWYSTSIGIGSDQGAGIGDDGEADWQHMRNIRTKLMAYGYTTVHEFYDGSHGGADASGNPNSTMVSTAVNSGAGLFMYCGHGSQNTCVTSNYSSTDISAGTNNHKYPFVISVACNNGTFTTGSCLSEAFLRASDSNGPKGAISCCGSSILMAWAEPMQVQDEIGDILTEQYGNTNIKRTLGGLFYNGGMSMLDAYGNSGTAREVMETWVMFGDPSVMIRTVTPDALTASHLINENIGVSQLVVNCNTDGALVSITQSGQILGTGIVSGGSVTISFAPVMTNAPLLVTATAFNKTPYQGNVYINPLGVTPNDISNGLLVYPNPANDLVTIEYFGNNATIELLDMLGRNTGVQMNRTAQNGFSKTTLDVSALEKGVYTVRVIEGGNVATKRIVVK